MIQGHKKLNVRGKRVVVLGLGVSGLWSARWLTSRGARVTVSEVRSKEALDPKIYEDVSALGVEVETGGHQRESVLNAELILISPGVPHDMDFLRAARKKGIPIHGELELASQLIDTPLIGVTGTNGKSTTTALLGFMLENAGLKVFVGGNLGTPLIAHAVSGENADFAVVEVSSFQLDTSETFSPFVSIILNITPDHLDRYPNYEAYIQSKLRILRNQRSGQIAILNKGDRTLAHVKPPSGVSILGYAYERSKGLHAFVKDRSIEIRGKDWPEKTFSLQVFRLPGKHNVENLLAATLAAMSIGVDPSVVQRSINEFKGLPHRLERVAEREGVTFYNDSKATNVDAAIKSILSFQQPLVLIAGGRDKGTNYLPLARAAKGRVKRAVFLGEAKELLGTSFEGIVPFSMAKDMEEAVSFAFSQARSGEVILLAPACSSFDMFSDYKHRGQVFRSVVERIASG